LNWELIEYFFAILGGTSVVISALIIFFGKTLLVKITSKYNEEVLTKLEDMKAEMVFSHKSYENQLPFIVDYFALFYEHYRRCQEYANCEIIRHPEIADICTKSIFENEIDDFKNRWEEVEPKIRLVLPNQAYKLHNEATKSFNEFNQESKRISANSNDEKENLRKLFEEIHEVKENLEMQLRKHLRA
jgi:hypothetical protein